MHISKLRWISFRQVFLYDFLAILFRPLNCFTCPKNPLNVLTFQSFDFEGTWWRLFQKRVVWNKLEIYVFILMQKMEYWKLFIVVSTSRSFPHSWLISWFVTRATQLLPLVEQEILTLSEHLSSSVFWWDSFYSIFSFMRYALSIVVGFFTFGHCPSIYGFWLPFWYIVAIVLSVLQFTDSDYLSGIL